MLVYVCDSVCLFRIVFVCLRLRLRVYVRMCLLCLRLVVYIRRLLCICVYVCMLVHVCVVVCMDVCLCDCFVYV